VGLAQAILHDPPVLVLDEPTDGLDPNQKHEVRSLIRDMARDKAIILSTHILEEVDAVCTRALIIARGRVVADGTPGQLESRSRFHNAVSLEIEGADNEDRHRILRAVPGVQAVELAHSGSDLSRYCLYPHPGRRILSDVSRTAREQGWVLRELRAERGRLDDVFRDITTGETAIS
jgi:ABC-2 type transport system ATP-binding protein